MDATRAPKEGVIPPLGKRFNDNGNGGSDEEKMKISSACLEEKSAEQPSESSDLARCDLRGRSHFPKTTTHLAEELNILS